MLNDEDFNQVIYAIDRAIKANQRMADELFKDMDYQAEMPQSDADMLTKARQMLMDNRST